MEWRLGRSEEIPEGGRRLFRLGDEVIGVFRVHGRLVAYANRCPHQGGPVCQGEVLGRLEELVGPDRSVTGERFSTEVLHLVCPWHGWEYELATGRCWGDSRLHLRAYPVEEREGTVYVTTGPRPDGGGE
ncbi:MAG TPA: Rieske (2Fe-2S) protein [Candidatus Dormibacteraeota bacterium]|nr:Rieske (2Fe-2S) protein [Candidatus Dormibacteraeota bacterium]